MSKLNWQGVGEYKARTAILGDFAAGDGVLFSLEYYPSCYRRGPWKLLVEVASGSGHLKWGCFDDQDQPLRWYHSEAAALSEAQAIADVLAKDRAEKK